LLTKDKDSTTEPLSSRSAKLELAYCPIFWLISLSLARLAGRISDSFRQAAEEQD
jgi:hypothetical protein